MSAVESALRTRGRLRRMIKTRESGGRAVKIRGSIAEILSVVEAPLAEVAREGVETRPVPSEMTLGDSREVDIFRMYDSTASLCKLLARTELQLRTTRGYTGSGDGD